MKEKYCAFTEWLLTVILLLVTFRLFYYTDFSDTLDNCVMLAETICNGNFLDYYQYAAQNAHPETIYSANYSIILYGIFSVWNFPVILLHIFYDFAYMESIFALLWCKLLILLTVIAVSFVIYKIASLYIKDSCHLYISSLLFLSCSCTIVPSMVAAQYDILALLPMLMGIYYYLKGNEKLFILCFSIAFPLKFFSIFIFIPLLLLREKRVIPFLSKVISTTVFYLLSTLPFYQDPWFQLCMETQHRDAVSLLIRSHITVAGHSFHLLLFFFIGLCVLCYLLTPDSDDYYTPIWCSLSAIAALLIFIDIRSYWIILLVPFAILTLFFYPKYESANLILFIIGSTAYTIHAFMNHWIYSTPELVTRFLPSALQTSTELLRYGSIRALFQYYDLLKFNSAFRTIFISCFLILIFLNIPLSDHNGYLKVNTTSNLHLFVLGQILSCYVLIFLILYANIAPAGPRLYTPSEETSYMEENLSDHVSFEQIFTPSDSHDIQELSFVARNGNNSRKSRNALTFELMDHTTHTILFKKSIGTSLIRDSEPTYLKLNRTYLDKEHTYSLKISSEISRTPAEIYFQSFTAPNEDHVLFINDIKSNQDLAFTLR